MGEPIKLYDRDGAEHIIIAPSIARAMVDAGLLFVQAPVRVTWDAPVTEPTTFTRDLPYGAGKTRPATEIIAALTPDDTHHDKPAVTPRRGKRKSSGEGGVL